MRIKLKLDTTKTKGVFKYVSLGDVHLGHRQNPTEDIIDNLNRLINDALLVEIDMLIITGDLFDRQLANGDDAVNAIHGWITLLLYKCSKHNVMIRIVEGTPSHDRNQSIFFTEQKVNANIDVDLHYATELSIVYEPKLDAHFLYVPDKWRPSTLTTLNEVKALLVQNDLEQVDFAIMHGAFSYQLPAIVPEPTHDEDAYLELVKYHILIGHVHIMTIHERIFAAGSFDRICQNDEIPKGMFYNTVKENGEYTSKFIENRKAKRFITLEVHSMSTKELFAYIKDTLVDLPPFSYIRLRCNPNDVAAGDINSFIVNYPNYFWDLTYEKVKPKRNSVNEIVEAFDMSLMLAIEPTSILDLLDDELDNHLIKGQNKTKYLELFKSFI